MLKDVAVIGCGIIGLSVALTLIDRGYAVTIYTKELAANNVSSSAGAMWLPIWVTDHNSEVVDRKIQAWAEVTLSKLKDQVGQADGLRNMPAVEMFASQIDPPGYFKKCLPDINCSLDSTLPNGFVFRWLFTTIMIEPKAYLDWLYAIFIAAGGKVRKMFFECTEDVYKLLHPVIVNCSGMGSRGLFFDQELRPVKGQLVVMPPTCCLKSIYAAGEFVVLPRRDALVLGSLFMEEFESEAPTDYHTDLLIKTIHGWSLTSSNKNLALLKDIVNRNSINDVISCLRPYRGKGPRLEKQYLDDKLIIHNYGHGGSGFTLAWGCAESVANLLES